jgi:hypothetical protein
MGGCHAHSLCSAGRRLPVLSTGVRARQVRERNQSSATLPAGHGGMAQHSDHDLALQRPAMVWEHKERCLRMREGGGGQWGARDAQWRIGAGQRFLRDSGRLSYLPCYFGLDSPGTGGGGTPTYGCPVNVNSVCTKVPSISETETLYVMPADASRGALSGSTL